VLLTHDLDFGAILANTHREKPSVVQIRSNDIAPGAIAPRIIIALRQMETELGKGALVSIDPQRARVRLLPLQQNEPEKR
jgi:predicted nuclease of predicted toxin-antitoxin system